MSRVLANVLSADIIIGLTYILTCAVSVEVLNPGAGLDWGLAMPLGYLLATIPYAVGGVWCYLNRQNLPQSYGFIAGTVAVLVERGFILGLGWAVYTAGGDGTMEGIDLITFIRGEAAPYFTSTYMLLGGLVSVLITHSVFRLLSRVRAQAAGFGPL